MAKKLRILFVTSRIPSHLTTGDRLRAYHLIEGLIKRGHSIDLLGFEDMACPRIETDIYTICNLVRPVHFSNIDFNRHSNLKHMRNMLAGAKRGFPRRVWQFHSPIMQKTFAEMISRTHYDVIHFSELGVAELLFAYSGELPSAKVFDLIDAVSMSVRSSLRYRFDITWPSRLIETYQLRRFEKSLLMKVDAGIVVALPDRDFLDAPPQLHTIPNGIGILPHIAESDKDIDIIFVGNMSAEANDDAVKWFVKSVWPIICAARPVTTFWVVGRDPRPSVSQLAGNRIAITGAVENVHVYLSRANVFVAPMRFGAGQKNKILEAFANRLPVVATREANEGIRAQDGQHILIRDNPDDMAQAILELLDQPTRRHSIGNAGYDLARAEYSWQRSIQRLESVYEQAMRKANIERGSSIIVRDWPCSASK